METKIVSPVHHRPTGNQLSCHACGGSQLRRKFSVPVSDGPYHHDKGPNARQIYRCDSCGHSFAAVSSVSEFADYYSSLSADSHSRHDKDQLRYQRMLGLVSRLGAKRVLDIGCGTGTFLAMLPPGVERFGIELTKSAADVARKRGIQIVEYEDLVRPELRSTFDVVTAIDVMEHVTDLQTFRRYLTMALRQGGAALLLTGDAESSAARLLGRYWYYMYGEEHITFFSSHSMRKWLQADFSEIEVTRTCHGRRRLEWDTAFRAFISFPIKLLLRNYLPMLLDGKKTVALYFPGDHILVRAIRN